MSGATLPGLLETYVANRDVKAFVLVNLGNRRNDDGERIVWEGSDTQYVLDETREWQVSEENYDPATGQSVVTLNATLRGVPMLFPHLPHPDMIMEESLTDTNGRCVFVALAKRMNEPENFIEGQLEEIFDELYDRKEEPWCNKHFTEVGVTPVMFASRRRATCVAWRYTAV